MKRLLLCAMLAFPACRHYDTSVPFFTSREAYEQESIAKLVDAVFDNGSRMVPDEQRRQVYTALRKPVPAGALDGYPGLHSLELKGFIHLYACQQAAPPAKRAR